MFLLYIFYIFVKIITVEHTIHGLFLNANFLRVLILTIAALLSVSAITVPVALISFTTISVALTIIAPRSSPFTIPIAIAIAISSVTWSFNFFDIRIR